MKKNYFIALLALVVNFASAQIEQTAYRGAFSPAPTAMWTDSWTNWNPQSEPYTDAATVVNVTANITTNQTWTTGKTYKLTGLIYVTNNATLTIQPGVVVKGVYSNTGTALIITRGAKLNAVGTAASPIVFTSAKAAGSRAAGDWGGVILLGKAGFNVNNGINNIEGITATANTEYGGGASPVNDDNSGTMKYCRIEFPGFVFSPNNEINGLTFGAVGNGTTIDYVQVSYSNDDSFEWFGGSVNCKHLVAYRGLDDDFDTDNGYKGIVQYALGIRDPSIADNPAISTSEGFESDNNAGGTASGTGSDTTSAIFTNVTMMGPSARATLSPTLSVASGHERPLRLRRVTQLKVYNSIFMDFKSNFLFVDGTTTVANANANTLKFKNNIIAGTLSTTYTGGVNPTSLNTWFTNNANSYVSGSSSILTKAYGTSSSDYQAGNLSTSASNLDYRPGTTAATGADFTDSSISPYVITVAGSTPTVTNRSYCVGEVASQLTAALTTTGVSLKWYTMATGGTALTAAPTPTTTVAGPKYYWVSQVDGVSGIESARVMITITVNALPTEVLGTITGQGPLLTAAGADPILNPAVYASAAAIGPYVGTSSTFTYTIPAFTTTPTPTYVWTVPQGVNIVSGQGTNTLTVNFLNVAYGAGTLGSIQVQAKNAGGCSTLAKTFVLTKALPSAPAALKMFNTASTTPATALTTFGAFAGTTTPLTLTASFAATTLVLPTSYQWELPTGVSLVLNGAVPTTTTVNYTAEPFLSPAASVPTTVGTIYWTVTYNKYTVSVNGVSTEITTSTAVQKIVGNATYAASSQAYLPYNNKYGTVITSNKPSILVSFEGVTNSATTLVYPGVKSINGVGTSVTSNLTNADYLANNPIMFYNTYTNTLTAPVPPSTNGTSTFTLNSVGTARDSKLLKLTAAAPTSPTTLVLTNPASATPTTAVTVISKFVGTSTPLTLTAGAVATAASYVWELPSGVNAVDLPAGAISTTVDGITTINSTTSRSITVNFLNVAPGTTLLYLGVKAKNIIGLSQVLTNGTLVPASTSTAKLLKVTASVPAVVATVAGQIVGVCNGSTKTYTITASALANSYKIVAPIGSKVTSASNTTNDSNELTTSDLIFDVLFPANLSTLTTKTIVITSINGVGNSLTNKTLTLTGTCVPKMIENVEAIALMNDTKVYPNPTSGELNITVNAVKAGTVDVQIYSLDGLTVKSIKSLNLQEGTNTINENISNFKNGIYFVKLTNTSNDEVIVKRIIKQ